MDVEDDEEMDVDDDGMDDPEVIHPYEEADPLNRPPLDFDYEPEAVAAPVSALGPLGKNIDALHSMVETLTRQMKDRQFQEMKEKDARVENKVLNEIKRELSIIVRVPKIPYDLVTDPPMRAGLDDLYVMARDATNNPARDDDDSVAPEDPQPSKPKAMRNVGRNGGPSGAPPIRECSFTGYLKCNPTVFHGNEGAVKLCRALTWWNSHVATLGLEVANGKS
nr:hypothetical protein [Tanacetum cinerariifolium]